MESNNLDTLEKERAKEQIKNLFGLDEVIQEDTFEKEKARKELEYVSKSAEVGWSKFNDLLSIFNPSSSEERKQAVIDTMRERDMFYADNSEYFNFGTKIVGGLVESISNPAELGAQIGIAVATGGSSIPVQIGAQVGFDLTQANIESYRYQNRLLTPQENLIVGATSALPDLLVVGGGALIRKNKASILKQSSNLGDVTINPRATIDSFDNIGMDNMSKVQQIKTDFPNVVKEEVYDVKISKPYNVYRDTILSVADEDEKKVFKHVFASFDRFDMSEKKLVDDTFLQRTFNKYEVSSNIERNTDLIGKYNNIFEEKYGKGFSKKTDIQKMIAIQNKENDLVDEFARNIEPTVTDYYTRWKAVKSKNPDKPVKINLNVEQIDNALNNIDSRFQTQKLYVQNEYLNIINKGYKNTPVDLNTFIKQIGADDKSVAEAWIKGNMNNIQSINRNKFFDLAYEDSVLLDKLNMKTSLFDMSDFEAFNRKYGNSFDEAGDIIYDGNLFKNISKANDDDKEILLRAMRDNSEQYVDFITNAKEVLDHLDEPNEFFKSYADFFETNTRTMKSFIKKNKDFIDAEYNKIVNEIPFDKTNPKVWKKNVAKAIAKRKEELARESIKINQTVNKQDLLAYAQRYYTDTVDRNTVRTVKLKDDMIDLFDTEIKPFYDNGIFKLQDGEDMSTHFARFIAELKKTRASARVTGEYKSVGELREFFNDDKMSEFFIGVNDGKFLKTNSEMVRDIFDFNTSAIARFSEYGSTSPYVLANKFKYKLNESMSKVYGKELSDAQRKVLNTAKERADRMFKATQIGYASELPSSAEIIAQQTRAGLRRGILGLSGIPELFGQNYFIGLSKAQKYAGFKEYLNQIRRISKPVPENFVRAKYTTAQLMKDVNINNYGSKKGFWDKVDNVAFMFQDMSDKQMKRFGEGFSTSILHTLPEDFNLLENEMKDLLKMKGVDINNYSAFRQFAKQHIDKNGFVVNMEELSKQIDFESNKYADMLRGVHYQLSDYIGNPLHKAKFNTVAMDEISKWYGLFRGFSRNMNKDTFTRFTQYVDANGVAKNRFSKTYLNSSYEQLVTPFGSIPSNIAKDLGLFTTATSALIVGGYGYNVAKEIIESDKTVKQKYAVLRTKADKIIELAQDKEMLKLIGEATELTGTNPIEALSSTDLPESLYNKVKKVYNTFTNEEKKTLGTNIEEGIQTLLDETAKTYLRIPYNISKSVYKQTQGDVETLPDKIYGFDKEDKTVFESYVRNPVFKKSIEIDMDNEMNLKQAQIDYMNNDTSSYDKLSENLKGVAEIIWSTNTIEDIQDFKTHYAVATKETETKEELVEKLSNERPYDNINVQETINVLNQQQPKSDFEKLDKKRQDIFYMIMKYKGVDKPTQQDYDLFAKEFKGAKTKDISRLLKTIYNINYSDFTLLYNDKDTRIKAINYYK